MRGTALLEELVQAAQRQGLAVRREAMSRGVSAGGLAVVKGVATIFVDDRASVETQIEVMANVLRRCDWSTVYVPPAVRALLGATGGDDLPAPPAAAVAGAQPVPAGSTAEPPRVETRRTPGARGSGRARRGRRA